MSLPEAVYDTAVRVEWKLMAGFREDEPSITNVELAKRVGVNANTIARWLKDLHYQRYENWVLTQNYAALSVVEKNKIQDVVAIFTEGATEMQDRLLGIIQSTGDPKLEASLCQDWLDRAGHAPQRNVANTGQKIVVLSAEAIEVLLRRSAEAGLTENTNILPPPVIDVMVERTEGS